MHQKIRLAVLALTGGVFSMIALGDVTGSPTLTLNMTLDLETASTGTSGGDILWTGTQLNPQSSTVGFFQASGFQGQQAYDQITQAIVQPLLQLTTSAPITAANLAGGTILVYKTRSGLGGKMLVVSASQGGALVLRFTTFGTGSGGGGNNPTIKVAQNNYSGIAIGLPNYGIAQGSLFYIKGSNMASVTTDLLSSASPGLLTTVQNVSVTVTVGTTSVLCPLYYVSPTQINAVLPGNTPVGNGTIAVSNNGVKSATVPIVVVQSAFGIINYNGTLAATYDANNAIITSTNSANPNQAIVIWGSGVGADPTNDDRIFPQKQNNLTNIPMQVFVGGVSAPIAYRGRSQFPGVDQIVITIPPNAPTGCFVSLVVVSNNSIVSNSTTIPIAASGKTCSDPGNPFTSAVLGGLAGKTTVRAGSLFIGQGTLIGAGNTNTLANTVGGTFASVTSYLSGVGYNQTSIGSCIINTDAPVGTTTASYLDAGTGITVTGPQGSLTMTPLSFGGTTVYTASNVPNNFIPLGGGGTYTFDNGAGGKDVGHFNTSLPMPQSFAWTNSATVTVPNRAQGVTVTWSGGAPGVLVTISGGSSATNIADGTTVSASFVCTAPLSAGSFTVPPAVLLGLPQGSGTLGISVNTGFSTFTATGLDIGSVFGNVSFSENVQYN